MALRSIKIPAEVLADMGARNPYSLEWPLVKAREAFQNLGGPERQVAERMLAGLAGFPPLHDDFDILDLRAGLSGGYRIRVASGTHIRVTVVAEYHQVPRQVHVLALEAGRREAGSIVRKDATNGRKSHEDRAGS